MNHKLEKAQLLKEMYQTFGKQPNKDITEQILKNLTWMNLDDFTKAIDEIKSKEKIPQNITQAVNRIYRDKQIQAHEQLKHQALFEGEDPTLYEIPKKMYYDLVIKSAFLVKNDTEISYYDFWSTVNEKWEKGFDNEELLMDAMKFGHNWLNKLKRNLIDNPEKEMKPDITKELPF